MSAKTKGEVFKIKLQLKEVKITYDQLIKGKGQMRLEKVKLYRMGIQIKCKRLTRNSKTRL